MPTKAIMTMNQRMETVWRRQGRSRSLTPHPSASDPPLRILETFLRMRVDSPSSCAEEEEPLSSEGRLMVCPCQEVLCRQGEGGGGEAGRARGHLLAHRCTHRPSG